VSHPLSQELADAEVQQHAARKRRIPAGTSEYQATWILDDDEVEDGGDEESLCDDGGDEGGACGVAAAVDAADSPARDGGGAGTSGCRGWDGTEAGDGVTDVGEEADDFMVTVDLPACLRTLCRLLLCLPVCLPVCLPA
jgi:hypothetical protein